jgi:EAL domain-containing protein (putative c-di-GMP-specific phosphodiesterase class I)
MRASCWGWKRWYAGGIRSADSFFLKQACRDATRFPAPLKVAVNLSPVQFRMIDLVGLVSDALDASGLAPHRLELEVTESVLLQNDEENLEVLHQLRGLGISIVLDDFGTGYSSFSYLRSFPFDKIKIDRTFVAELENRSDCAAIVSAITGLARSLGIATTAEGVETEQQLTLLRAAGCGQAQGYLFGRPGPLAEIDFAKMQAAQRPRVVA